MPAGLGKGYVYIIGDRRAWLYAASTYGVMIPSFDPHTVPEYIWVRNIGILFRFIAKIGCISDGKVLSPQRQEFFSNVLHILEHFGGGAGDDERGKARR